MVFSDGVKIPRMEFSKVAEMNIEKLQDRFERNKIHGSGDNR